MQLTGAQALIRSLEQEGVDTIFGLPGGAILPVYDPLLDSSIRHILVRHEQGAGHMAEGYALATGRPGVAMVTSGPGATNIVTPIGNAHMDSTPLVVITGQVATASIGTDAFQECDITGITMGITKHNFLVQSAQEIPRGRRGGVPLRDDRTTGTGPDRRAQGRDPVDDGLVVPRERRRVRPARLPARGRPRRGRDRAGRGADCASPSGRCSTWAGARSSRAPPKSCWPSPSEPASRS